ncbi:hypothetical protein TrRE_jg12425, partial [Triparma retinervis]
ETLASGSTKVTLNKVVTFDETCMLSPLDESIKWMEANGLRSDGTGAGATSHVGKVVAASFRRFSTLSPFGLGVGPTSELPFTSTSTFTAIGSKVTRVSITVDTQVFARKEAKVSALLGIKPLRKHFDRTWGEMGRQRRRALIQMLGWDDATDDTTSLTDLGGDDDGLRKEVKERRDTKMMYRSKSLRSSDANEVKSQAEIVCWMRTMRKEMSNVEGEWEGWKATKRIRLSNMLTIKVFFPPPSFGDFIDKGKHYWAHDHVWAEFQRTWIAESIEEVFGLIWNVEDRWYDDQSVYLRREIKINKGDGLEAMAVDWLMVTRNSCPEMTRTRWKVTLEGFDCYIAEVGEEGGGRIIKLANHEGGCAVEMFAAGCRDSKCAEDFWLGRSRSVEAMRRWFLEHKDVRDWGDDQVVVVFTQNRKQPLILLREVIIVLLGIK